VVYEPLGIAIVAKSSDDNFRQENISKYLAITTYPANRENSIEFNFEANKSYLVIPHTFHPNIDITYTLSLFSKSTVNIVELTQQTPSTVIQYTFTNDTAGGCVNYPTWRHNPQFVLEFDKPGKIVVVMEQTETVTDAQTLQYIGFSVWKTSDEERVIVPSKDQVFQSPITNSARVDGEFTITDPGKFIIMPSTFHPNVIIPFTLNIIPKSLSCNPAKDDNMVLYKGQWKSGQSGGCKNNKLTWKQNPTYPVNITQPNQHLVIILSVTGDKMPIGYYIFDSGLHNTVFTSKFATVTEISSEISVPQPGSYIILPCTFNPNIFGDFELRVYQTNS